MKNVYEIVLEALMKAGYSEKQGEELLAELINQQLYCDQIRDELSKLFV